MRVNNENKDTVLLWTDVETTGLDPTVDGLLEVGLQATTTGLEPLADMVSVVVQPGELGRVHPKVQRMHTANGLLRESLKGLPVRAASRLLDSYLREWAGRRILLAGSSVGFDRRWFDVKMPGLLDGCHHRVFDVSALDEMMRAWKPGLWEARPKHETQHRVADCLTGSLTLARYYREALK